MKLKLGINKIYEWIINLLFPIACVSCGAKDTMFCQDCLARILPPRPNIDKNILSITSYKDPHMKRALWLFKFHNRKTVAEAVALRLYEEIIAELENRELFENFTNPILVPIPISKKRLRTRGYNQAEILARAIARESNGSMRIDANSLLKKKETPRQALIHERNKRLHNLIDSFSVQGNTLRGKNIIIVDDITTTGATIVEARRALKKAGARKILAITIAH